MPTCPHCGGALGPSSVTVELVRPDGCRLRGPGRNVRTRDRLGDGAGSLADEMGRGVRTPWSSLGAKLDALAVLEGEARAYAEALPHVREAEDG